MDPMTARSILPRTEATRRRRRALATAVIALCAVPAMNACSDDREEVLASTSHALSGDGLVISQLSVFGSSDFNNEDSKYNRNFVELFNRSHVPVSLDGLSVQTGGVATNFGSGRVALPNVSIVPGGHFLIAFGVEGTRGIDLPAADLDASTTLVGVPAWGKIAIARSQDALDCGAANNRCAAEKVVDMLGWGASDYEGSPFKGALRPQALLRAGDGCTDTNNNAADFSLASPVPRNSASSANVCPNEDLNDAGADAPSDASDGSIDGATTDAGLSDASSDASAEGGTLDAGGDASPDGSIADASHDAPADGAAGGDPSSDGGAESPRRGGTLPDASGKGASPTAEDAAETLSGDDSGCSSSGRTVASRPGTALLGLGLLIAAIVRRRRPCCAST